MFRPKVDRVEYGGAMIGEEEIGAIMRVIRDQGGKRWTIGPESQAFEEELAKQVGVSRAMVVNSGSSALLVALAAMKLKKGANVVIPAVNFPTAFNSIIQNGYNPVVVDVDKNMLLDLDKLEELVKTWKIDAVVAVNVAANPVDYVRLRKIVGPDVKILCDNCDGLGTIVNGAFVDALADVSCVSFHAAHIITTGEGGAILTNDEKLADTAVKMREWGRASGTDNIYQYEGFPEDYRERYVYEEIGWNLKPLELQCAMGRVQLKKLYEFYKARARNYALLKVVFDKYKDKFETVESLPGAEVCWFSFPFYCRGVSRKRVMYTLESNNIECRTIFSGNITRHPAYKDVKMSVPLDGGELPQADDVMKNGVFISVHPSITIDMIKFIDEVLETV